MATRRPLISGSEPNIPEPEYIDTAELFDELPGVSGYFRFLCLHTVIKDGDGYVLYKTY